MKIRKDGILETQPVKDDFTDFYADHRTLVASTDTTITFSSQVRMVKIINWDTSNRILVKNGPITSDTDSTASRVGKAPASDIPNDSYFPFVTSSIHIRSAATSEITIEAYF